MGAAYFITLDHPHPDFDPHVNGKAVASEAEALQEIAASIGLKAIEEFFSMTGDEMAAMTEEFDVDSAGDELPINEWFDADEGLSWISTMRAHLQANPSGCNNSAAVLADLAEYEKVLTQAKSAGAKWCLSVDF